MPILKTPVTIGFLGFGEVARIFADGLSPAQYRIFQSDLSSSQERIFAYDIAFKSENGPRLKEAAQKSGVIVTDSPAELANSAQVILSLVTASTSGLATQSIAPYLGETHFFVDLNSSSPAIKIENAKLLEKNGVHFIDAAVMDSVPAKGMSVPIIAVGNCANEWREQFNVLGFNITLMEGAIGKASAYKMLRSIISKGLETLFLEGFWAAQQYGLLDEVFKTIASSIEGKTLEQIANTILVSAGKHAPRKKSEMEAALATIQDVGVPGKMTEGTISIYEELIKRRQSGAPAPDFKSWRDVVDFLSSLPTN